MMRNEVDSQALSQASTMVPGRAAETEAFYSSDTWPDSKGQVGTSSGIVSLSSSTSSSTSVGGAVLSSSKQSVGAGRGSAASSGNISIGQMSTVATDGVLVPGGLTVATSGEVSGTLHDVQKTGAMKFSDTASTAFPGGAMASINRSGSSGLGFTAQLQQLQAYGLLLKRKVDSKTKPWAEFLRLSSFERPPNTAALVADRVDRNLRYFSFNYALIATAIVAACLLTSPFTIVTLCIFGILFLYVSTQGEQVQIGTSTQIPAKQAQLCIGVAACFCLLLSAQVLFAAAGSGLVVILLHACFHRGRTYQEIQAETVQDDFA